MVCIGEKVGLEDNYTDILQKALRGLHMDMGDLAERAGVPAKAIGEILNGQVDPDAIERLAFVLNLHGPSLVALARGQWEPKPVESFPGLAMFTTWYGDMTVN